MKNRMTRQLTYAILLLWWLNDTIAKYTIDRYAGSRREAFIQRFEGWWKAIRRAYRYKAAHRYRRFQKNVSQNTPDDERVYTAPVKTAEKYTGKRRNPDNSSYKGVRRAPRAPWNLFKDTKPVPECRDVRTADGLICTPVVVPPPVLQSVFAPAPADPWEEYMLRMQRNNEPAMTGKKGPYQNVDDTSSVLGRRSDRTGVVPGQTQQMRSREGGSDHHRPGGAAYRGGGVQRTSLGLSARLTAVYDVVSEGGDHGGEPGRGVVSRLRRLSVSTRGGERPDEKRSLSTHRRCYLRHLPRVLRMREADSQ